MQCPLASARAKGALATDAAIWGSSVADITNGDTANPRYVSKHLLLYLVALC